MWDGLLISANPPNLVTRNEAQILAERLHGKTFDNVLEWSAAVSSVGQISEEDRAAVIINGICPTWCGLEGTGTVPVCFVNRDTVAIDARAIVNTPAGTPVSRAGFREVIDIAPPIFITRSLTSQLDFDAFLRPK